MATTITYSNGDKLIVEDDLNDVADAIRLAPMVGELRMAQVNGDHPVHINVAEIRSLTGSANA